MTTAADAPRLGRLTKVTYGVGSIAYGVAGQALATSVITLYLNQVIGIPAALVGLAIGLSLIIDAIVDPLIGQWSDNFRSRWGRRHPFMYAAALPCAIAFYFLWHAPVGWEPQAVFVFMLVMLITVRFCVALYETASTALAPELAPDYHERTNLISYRFFFFVVGGAAMTMLLYLVFLRKDATHPLGILNKDGYAQFGTVSAIVMFVAIMISALATHRLIPQLKQSAQRQVTLLETGREILGTLTNPSLVVLMSCGLISGIAGGVTATLNSYFYIHFWGLAPQLVGLIVVIYLPAAFIGSMLAPQLSKRLGKKLTMISLFTASLITGAIPMALRLIDLMPPNGSPWLVVILFGDALIAGTLGLMGFIIIYSMISDVVEDAAVKTGKRSEGLLFAANGLLPKVTTGIGAAIGGVLIQAVHFPDHAIPGTVAPEILRQLAIYYLPINLVLTSLAIGVLFFFRIDQATHEANLEALRRSSAMVAVGEPESLEPGAPPITHPT